MLEMVSAAFWDRQFGRVPDAIGQAALVLLAVTLLAASLPARRATRTNPLSALRQD